MKNVPSTFIANLLILPSACAACKLRIRPVFVLQECVCLCVCRQPASGTLAIGWRPKRLSRLKSFQSGYQSIRSSSQRQPSRAATECNKLLRFTAHTSQVATGNGSHGSRGSGSPTWATVVASCCMLHYPLAIVHCT